MWPSRGCAHWHQQSLAQCALQCIAPHHDVWHPSIHKVYDLLLGHWDLLYTQPMISQLCSIKHSSALDMNVSRNKTVDLSRLSSYEQTKTHFASSWRPSQTWMTILFGYPKSSRDFIFARASQIWAIQSIKHSTFDVTFGVHSAQTLNQRWTWRQKLSAWLIEWLKSQIWDALAKVKFLKLLQ